MLWSVQQCVNERFSVIYSMTTRLFAMGILVKHCILGWWQQALICMIYALIRPTVLYPWFFSAVGSHDGQCSSIISYRDDLKLKKYKEMELSLLFRFAAQKLCLTIRRRSEEAFRWFFVSLQNFLNMCFILCGHTSWYL